MIQIQLDHLKKTLHTFILIALPSPDKIFIAKFFQTYKNYRCDMMIHIFFHFILFSILRSSSNAISPSQTLICVYIFFYYLFNQATTV